MTLTCEIQDKEEIVIPDTDIILDCNELKSINQNEFKDYLINKAVDETYENTINNPSENPETQQLSFLFNKSFLNNFFIYSLIFSIILIILSFFLFENKTNFLVLIGFFMLITALFFLLIILNAPKDLDFSNVSGEGINFMVGFSILSYLFLVVSYSLFYFNLVFAVILLGSGISIKIKQKYFTKKKSIKVSGKSNLNK